MIHPAEHLSAAGRSLLDRRQFLSGSATALGYAHRGAQQDREDGAAEMRTRLRHLVERVARWEAIAAAPAGAPGGHAGYAQLGLGDQPAAAAHRIPIQPARGPG